MTTSYDVHVMGSDGVELRCIRVPVTATSTVRQLATDCLSRFVMQSRFTSPNIDVVVDDVTSAGCSLFYNDPIAAVVRPTELLALHIRNVSSTDVVPRRIAMHTNTTGVSPADASVIKVSAATIPSAAAPIAIVSTAEIKRGRDETPATEPAQPRRPQPAAPVAPAPAATAPQANNARQVKDKNLGWGEASHKTYPQNYVADPDQMIRQLRKQQKAAAEKKKLEAKQAAAEQQAAEAPQDVLTSKPLGPQQINTAAASLSKLELYCDQDVQEVRRPLTAYNVARQLTYA